MTKGKFKGAQCALHFHKDAFFGLTKIGNQALFGGKVGKKWQPLTDNKIKSNALKVDAITWKIAEDVGVINSV